MTSASHHCQKTLWAWTVATFFGAGLGKPGPGTWGSVAAVLLWAAFAWLLPSDVRSSSLIALLAGIVLSHRAGRSGGHHCRARKRTRTTPASWSSTKWPASGLRCLAARANWRHALIALILFRLFDITKPFPARQLESLPEGWGIVFDDVAAGLYALGVASVAAHFIPCAC